MAVARILAGVGCLVCDIKISNQFVITRALHFAQYAYYQASVTITLGHRV